MADGVPQRDGGPVEPGEPQVNNEYPLDYEDDADEPQVPLTPAALRKRRLGKLLRFGFLALVLVFAAIWVWTNREQVAEAWSRVTLVSVMASLLAATLGAWTGVPAWRALLSGLGSTLRLRDAQRVFLMGQLGKYIPGGVWTVLAQATMAKELHVPRSRSGTAGFMAILLAVVTSAALGGACLGIAGHEVLGKYGWMLIFVLPLLALLHPDVLVWVGKMASRITKRNVHLERIPERVLLQAAAWLLVGQVLIGLSFYFLVSSISGHYGNPLLSIGLFSLASAAGIVIIFAPAGAGARELILAFGLSTVTDSGSAVLIVLLSRLVLTIVDVLLATVAAGIGRRRHPVPNNF